jgi:hypothetical protein
MSIAGQWPEIICQRLPCAGVGFTHPPDDHLHDVVQASRDLLSNERRQREALILLHLQHPACVKAQGLSSKVADFHRRVLKPGNS